MALTKKDSRLTSLDDDEEGGLGQWYAEHATAINWILSIVLIAIIGWRVYGWFHQTRLEQANYAYGEVQKAFDTAIQETDPEKRSAALNAVPSKADSVLSQHSGQPVTKEAQLVAANALYYMAESTSGTQAIEGFKKAQAAYQKYLGMAENNRERATGQLALGNTTENLLFLTEEKQYGEEALAAYKEVQQLAADSYLAAEAKMAQARLLQAMQGKQAEARKLFEEVAAARKLPEPSRKSDETTLTTQMGQELSPEEIARIRSFANQSYEHTAKKAIERLQGLPTQPEK